MTESDFLKLKKGDKVRDLSGLGGTIVGFGVGNVQVEWPDGFKSYLHYRHLSTIGEVGHGREND